MGVCENTKKEIKSYFTYISSELRCFFRMTNLIFYGGVNEIGGNKILLEDNDTKIFLDFGMSFNQAGKYFSEFLQPRKCCGLGDFLEFGLLPDLKGLYRQDYLKHMGRISEDTEFQGVLLSHAHADHAAYIHHLRSDIPIYCSKPTHAILKALNDTSSGSFTDLTELVRCFETYINKQGLISKKVKNRHPEIIEPREFNILNFGEKFRIDNLEIVPYNVDHSLPGATGYIIHTSSGNIIYTGDFRFHGRRREKTEDFMKACLKEKPDVLIVEGTRIDSKKTKEEFHVESEVAKASLKSKGLTVCNWPVRDTDRMISFLKASKKVDKTLTVDLKQAYLVDQLRECECDEVALPEKDDENLAVYAMRKTWGVIGSDWADRIIRADYDKWERNYLEKTINYTDVRNKQRDFLFYCNNFQLKELIDLQPKTGSIYIKSVCEPFDIEMEIDWKRIENWIKHFKMDLYKTHVSGHSSGPELKNFIETIKPKKVFPIHTEKPEMFTNYGKNIHLLEKVGQSIMI
jgi:ribonuclease J